MCDTSQSCPQLKQDWDDSPVKIRGNAVALLYPSPSHHNPAAGWLSGVVPPVPVDSIDPLAAWQGPRMAQDGPGAGAKHSVARLTWMTWLSFATVKRCGDHRASCPKPWSLYVTLNCLKLFMAAESNVVGFLCIHMRYMKFETFKSVG